MRVPLPCTLLLALAAPVAAACAGTMEHVEVPSAALGHDVRVAVYLPDGYEGGSERYPVVYFLHGLFGNERKWEQRGIPAQLDALIADGAVPPMIVVTPNGENSMYVDWKSGKADWEEFVARELVAAVDARYRTRAERTARGVSGDSMGGYGALHLAFRNPEVFGSVSAHSAAIYPVDPELLPERVKRSAARWSDVYGDPIDVEHWKAYNPLHLAATVPAETLRTLAIYFDCGTEDRYGFDRGAAELAKILDEREVPHEFHLWPGDHGREYFEQHAHLSLAFHGRVFAGEPATGTPVRDV